MTALEAKRSRVLRLLVAARRELAGLWSLLSHTLYWLYAGKRSARAVAEQMYSIGNRSLPFVTLAMSFIGAIIVFQSGTQAQRLIPDMRFLGATYIKILVREIGPTVGAMPLATRVGAGIAAELGTMVVTEQVDALRMSGAEPVDFLVVPRFIGSVVMGAAVLVTASAVCLFVGMVTARVLFDVHYATFLNFSMVSLADVVVGLLKCVAYGVAIAIISAHQGLEARGSSEGVGRATTRAVVGSCFAVIVLDFLISTGAYFIVGE
jgi:phospholipid/cholesterol/gamma-HCH transport system permease protein